MQRTIIFAITLTLLAACGQQGPIPIPDWETYREPYFSCSFRYPKGWSVSSEGGRVTLYSSAQGGQKFFDPSSKSPDASQVIVGYERTKTGSLEVSLNSYLDELKAQGFTIGGTTPRTLGTLPAFEVAYKGTFESGDRLSALRLLTMRDSILYYASYAGFNDSFEHYRSAYDTLLATMRLPELQTSSKKTDPALPSEEFISFENKLLEIRHPANFEASFPQPKGDIAFSVELKGYRNDCTIRIDAMPAKGLTAEKVFEQNAKFYKKTSQGETTIDGVRTPFLNYLPTKGVESRVYFLIKKDTVFRIIANVYQPLKKDVWPAFEKTVSSLHIK